MELLRFASGRTMLLNMWRLPLRCLMAFVIALAFLGGTTVQALPPSNTFDAAGQIKSAMPGCVDSAMTQAGTLDPAPRKGITPDCLKLAKCLGIPLSFRPAQLASISAAYAPAAYWSHNPLRIGRSPIPLPFPPRSA